LLSGRNFETRTYEEEIAAASFQTLNKGVMAFMNETNFKRFLMIIMSAGFVDSSLLQSRQSALNFAYALYLKLRTDSYPAEKIEHFVRRWFVLSLLIGRYSGQVETRFEQDIRQIDEGDFGNYLQSVEEAELSDTFWSVGLVQALKTSNSNHPAFKAFLASQVKNNTRGFMSKGISVRSMLEHRGDVHHIFPRDYLKKEFGLKRSEYNQVANYVYTQQEINIAIGNKPPKTYMGDILKQCETGKPIYGGIMDLDDLRTNLDECAIPIGFMEGKLYEYQDFLSARRKAISQKLKDYYFSL